MASTDLSSPLVAEKMALPSSSRETLAMRAMRLAMSISRWVQVGDLNMTVSETMAAAMRPAILAVGIRPFSWYIPPTRVVVLPTGSLRT